LASQRAAFIGLCGLAQGLALVTLPAMAPVLTGSVYGLSSSAYGALFLPQAAMAVAGSLLGSRLEPSVGARRLALTGLALDTLAMAAVLASTVFAGTSGGYLLLLLATTSLGIGFGICVPALNVLIAAEVPTAVNRATLTLNALLGLGTALAPALSAVFVGLGIWWGLPVVTLLFLGPLLVRGRVLRLAEPALARADATDTDTEATGRDRTGAPAIGRPSRTWVFLGFALLYGVVETVNGNWSTVYAQGSLGASATVATLSLAAFWGAVTVGRLFFGSNGWRLPLPVTYRTLPFIAAGALFVAAVLPRVGGEWAGVLVFAVAGLGCSALLPLTISFAEAELKSIAQTVSGLIFAAYQVGYGIAAFGVGPLMGMAGIGLSAVMAIGGGVALALGVVAALVAGRRRSAGPIGAAA
jgi:MFS family permease